jgi:hypothetical protein
MLLWGKFLHADKRNFAISILGVLHFVDVVVLQNILKVHADYFLCACVYRLMFWGGKNGCERRVRFDAAPGSIRAEE